MREGLMGQRVNDSVTAADSGYGMSRSNCFRESGQCRTWSSRQQWRASLESPAICAFMEADDPLRTDIVTVMLLTVAHSGAGRDGLLLFRSQGHSPTLMTIARLYRVWRMKVYVVGFG